MQLEVVNVCGINLGTTVSLHQSIHTGEALDVQSASHIPNLSDRQA